MLSDVVSPASYLTFNVTIAHIIGLVNSVYCSELLDIYNKAKKKHKLDEQDYFVVNRDYVKSRTSIKIDDQYLCDASLSKVGLVKSVEGNPDKIFFNVEQFMKIIAEDDSKVLSQIAKKVTLQRNDADAKILKREKLINTLKDSVDYGDDKINELLCGWIDSIMLNTTITKDTVKDFQAMLKKYAKTNTNIAVRVVTIAKNQNILSCASAIEMYEKEQSILSQRKNSVRITEVKTASKNQLSDIEY